VRYTRRVKSSLKGQRKGQSFLALVFLIGGIVAVVGVTIAFFASSFVDSGFGYQASASAEAAATSGAEDALLQLDRNASFASAGYSIAVGSTTAKVSVTQGNPSPNFVTVSSTAIVAGRAKKISVILSENASTSQFTVVSWEEVQ
jgi:hypothetical protein